MSSLSIFQYTDQEIRFFPNGNSFEVAASDIAKVLEYTRNSDFLKLVEKEYRSTAKSRTSSGEKKIITISEFGLYAALTKSHQPKAKPFQKWLFEEVLPEIRRTGKYSGKKKKPQLTAEQVQEQLALRDIHRSLNDATKAYIERHKEEMSARRQRLVYTHIAQKISKVLVGHSATKVSKDSGISFRDLLSTDQLRLLQQLERLAALLIEKQDLYPTDAILEAANRLMVGI